MWLLVAGSATYWALKMNAGQGPSKASFTAVAAAQTPDTASMARVLGAAAAQPLKPSSASNRFALKGVVSGALGKEAALIAIDDKPARAFIVGSAIEEGLVLQSATARRVTLSATPNGPALMTLEMPVLK
jgi:general secretion pathway protein C